jgi:hypothetical protein
LPLPAPSNKASAQILWWTHHLKPALFQPAGSAERAAAIEELISRPLLDWNNRPVRIGRSTAYRKLAELEEGRGMAGLARRRRRDTRKPKVVISRVWDNAVPFDDATKATIAENLKQQIRGLRAKKTNRKWVLALARQWLKGDTAAYGFRPNDPAEFDRICTIPVKLYTAEARYEIVYDYTSDRDRFDNQLPRGGKRTIIGMRPMQMVVADVHPIDIRVTRSDGSIGAARLLAFMDIATRRVWAEVLLVEADGGVRNTDVIQAFATMAADSSWGLPELFYCDNGSEYLFADHLGDALSLNGRYLGDDGRTSRVIRAIPYNASAKPIEAWFHRFESDHLRHVPGWHGGKLGAPKRPARGKLPAPFEGGFDAFVAAIKAHIAAYNSIAQYGELKGDSPAGRFAKHVAEGWRATVMDDRDLLTVFTRTETRVVRQHGISVDGRTWSMPELDAHFGSTVLVKIPVLGFGFNELWVGDEQGEFIGFATPDIRLAFNDARQALHSASRKQRTTAATHAMRRKVPDIDVGHRIVALADEQTPHAANDPAGVVSVGNPGNVERAIIPSRSKAKSREQAEAERLAFVKFQIANLGKGARQ